MTAIELRIGNLINEFCIPRQIIPLDIINLSRIEQSGKICIDLTPIPLTEEWLLKFGFWKYYGRYYLQNKIIRSTLIVFDKDFKLLKPTAIIKIEYVHQLQNLYFVLTGEEFEINKK